ncbi:MAG TPA: hypothetical protein DEA08_24560 [Planctomycetes bacterium]|nr:hypothetical protein [Planctomycetota bacterium]
MQQPALALVLLSCALLTAPADAQELAILGEHATSGKEGERSFTGALKITPDARFTAARRYADGAQEERRGRVRLDRKALVLEVERPRATWKLVRKDSDDEVRWELRKGALWLRVPMGRKESKLETFARALKRKDAANFLVENNRGVVDEGRIERSRQPGPKDLLAFKQRGGRTVLSLNGRQDERYRYQPPGGEEQRVVLEEFISQQGLAHEWVGMSASRAPSPEELVAVFRVLLDERRHPVLLHCRGGADRTGVIGALYQIEFLGVSKEQAKRTMRKHLWMAAGGTEIQGAYVDLYQKGDLRRLLERHGVAIPARFREPSGKRWF